MSDGESLSIKFGKCDKSLVGLLEMMLEYNPALRPTAEHLLSLPMFDDIRVKKLEAWHEIMKKRIKILRLDRDGANVLDDDIDMWTEANFCRDHTHIQYCRNKIQDMLKTFHLNKTTSK